ncbi:MAG: methyltransferase family protein [Thermoguttaceae bacterium]
MNLVATQKLLTDGPYSFCRNPMALGTLVFYFSIAVVASSLKALLAVALLTVCLLVYIRLIEEKEMEQRFGQAYSRYRQRTPFIMPRVWPFVRKRAT